MKLRRKQTPDEPTPPVHVLLKNASPAQLRYIAARITSNSDVEAAAKIGYNVSTIYQWPNKAELDEVVRTYLLDTVDAAKIMLRSATVRSVVALEEALSDRAHKVEAARAILDRAGIPAVTKQETSGSLTLTAENLTDEDLAAIASGATSRESSADSEAENRPKRPSRKRTEDAG